MGNTFGHIFRLTTFGESHGPAIGGVIDGCPAGVAVDYDLLRRAMDRRRGGQSALTTARREADEVQLLSGIFEGRTTGTPIAFIIRNDNTRSEDYDNLRQVYRPSHADYSYSCKYGIRDHRGGGRSSARETAARVVAGAFAQMVLRDKHISIEAFTTRIGSVGMAPDTVFDSAVADGNVLHCPDAKAAQAMTEALTQAKAAGDSLGAWVHCIVKGVPAGWGEPVYDKLQAMLAAAMLSIPACKGFEYGSGFDVSLPGSQANDAFCIENGRIRTASNHSGGIQGGISNGEDIYFNLAFKPIASISQPQQTVTVDGQPTTLQVKGRHDACVLPRALPVVEAMTAITLLDAYLMDKAIHS